jgi:hypothetical protein
MARVVGYKGVVGELLWREANGGFGSNASRRVGSSKQIVLSHYKGGGGGGGGVVGQRQRQSEAHPQPIYNNFFSILERHLRLGLVNRPSLGRRRDRVLLYPECITALAVSCWYCCRLDQKEPPRHGIITVSASKLKRTTKCQPTKDNEDHRTEQDLFFNTIFWEPQTARQRLHADQCNKSFPPKGPPHVSLRK